MTRVRWIVNTETQCWEWQLRIDRRGYGRLSWQGKTGYLAHRWSYETHVGPIPDGLTVDHLCFNTRCINPAHLRLLTLAENRANQREAFKTHCVNGHEFTPENTYRKSSSGQRSCRACNRAAVARYKQRNAA